MTRDRGNLKRGIGEGIIDNRGIKRKKKERGFEMNNIILKTKVDLKMYKELHDSEMCPDIENEIKLDYSLIFQVNVPENKSLDAIIEDLEDFLSFIDNN